MEAGSRQESEQVHDPLVGWSWSHGSVPGCLQSDGLHERYSKTSDEVEIPLKLDSV